MKKQIFLMAQYYNEIYDKLSNLSLYYMDDREIRNTINEEPAAFYVGDKSIDDVIRFIHDRVDKYISEAK